MYLYLRNVVGWEIKGSKLSVSVVEGPTNCTFSFDAQSFRNSPQLSDGGRSLEFSDELDLVGELDGRVAVEQALLELTDGGFWDQVSEDPDFGFPGVHRASKTVLEVFEEVPEVELVALVVPEGALAVALV